MKSNCIKNALLAVAGVALILPTVHGATVTPDLDHLILGFRATAGQGVTHNLEVDLGPVDQFYGQTPGSTVLLSKLSVLDLSAIYGATWINRSDLFWGAVATTGRTVGYSNAVVNVPVGTLWATVPNCGTPFNRASVFAQKNASSAIEAVFVAGSPLNGATSTANSSFAADIDATVSGSWSKQDLKSVGTSFGYFNPTIDNFEGTNVVASQLFELQPGSGVGTYLGDLYIDVNGLHFRATAPTAAIVKNNIVIQAGSGCTTNVTVADIDNGSTGYCLALSIDASGPLPIGQTNVTLTVIDGGQVTNSQVASVTIAAAAPSVASHANITTNLASGCSAVVSYNTPAGTGCDTPLSAVVCSPASPATLAVGVHTVQCVVTDNGNKTGTNSFTVTVTSSAAPTLTTVADSTNSVNGCSKVVSYSLPTASGCNTPLSGVVCTPASSATFSLGSTLVSCSVTDALNAVGTTSFHVVVNSTAVPAFSATSTISTTVPACSVALAYAKPTASNCVSSVSVTCVPDVGATFYAGSNTTVNCTAVDAGNSTTNTTSFTVTVTSSAGATFGSVSPISTNAPVGQSSVVVSYVKPTATDCNGSAVVTCTPASGATFNLGTSNVVCTAAGHTNTVGFAVTVTGSGINGVKTIVQGFTPTTDPKLGTARLNSLLSSLTIAAANLNKYKTNTHTHVVTTNVTAACAQLNAELIKAKIYFQLHLLSTNSYAALTNAVAAQQTAIGCKK